MRPTNWISVSLTTLALLSPLGSPATAGEGSIQNGKLDLLVYFSYAEQDPSSWEPVFTEYSKLLLNSTEGGLQLGTVSFTTSEDLKQGADIWIDDTTGGARANLQGLGVRGRHMFISQLHKSISGATLGQFGLLHESGHYLWGCHDEYAGVTGYEDDLRPEHVCSSSGSGISCPMDGGSSIPGNNQRTEFCTKAGLGFALTEHGLGVDSSDGKAVRTYQEYRAARSCWEQIEASGVAGLVHPVTEPTTLLLVHDAVVFDYDRLTSGLSVALLIDRSGSMQQFNNMQLAISGSHTGIGLMKDGQNLAVVSFNQAPQVIFPLAGLDAVSKTGALNAVSSLFPQGGTGIGTALLTGIRELDKTTGGSEIIILLTDGITSTPPAADDPVVLSALQSAGCVVFSIALGLNTDDEELQAVSQATGGRFFKALDGRELPSIISSILSEVTGGIPVEEVIARPLPVGQTVLESFEVNSLASAVRISLNYALGADLDLELTAPDGGTIRFGIPATGVAEFETNVSKAITVEDPIEGVWMASVSNPSNQAQTYDLLAFVESKTLSIVPQSENSVVFPEPMALSLSVVAGTPVGGALATAVVTRPDASIVNIELYDDGLAVHADEVADDGVYSALFSSYVGDGTYRFDLSVDGSNVQAASNLECGIFGIGENGQVVGLLDEFQGAASLEVVLSGMAQVPATGSALLVSHASTADEVIVASSAPTPVAAFALEASADEALILLELRLSIGVLRGAAPDLEGLALHLDSDADGQLDSPSIPLAIARVGSNDELIFEQFDGQLARLAEGRSHAFLVTAGEALPSLVVAGPVVAAGASIASLAVPSGANRGRVAEAALRVLAGCAALLAIGVWVRTQRSEKQGAARAQRPRRLVGLALLACAAAAPSCHHRHSHYAAEEGGEYQLTLEASGVTASGAVTGGVPSLSGADLAFQFELK